MKYCDTCKVENFSKDIKIFSRHKKSKKHKLKEVQNGGIEEQNRDTEVKNGGTEVQNGGIEVQKNKIYIKKKRRRPEQSSWARRCRHKRLFIKISS